MLESGHLVPVVEPVEQQQGEKFEVSPMEALIQICQRSAQVLDFCCYEFHYGLSVRR